jgi:hypothetical protein
VSGGGAGLLRCGTDGHAAAWTGSEAVVWGGCDGPLSCGNGLFTGGRYDLATDSWTRPRSRAPDARASHTGVWTGRALLDGGGLADSCGSYTATGGLLDLGVVSADGFESGDTGGWGATLP